MTEAEVRRRERERLKILVLLTLKMQEGAMSQGMQAFSQSQRKSKEMNSCVQPPEGTQPC